MNNCHPFFAFAYFAIVIGSAMFLSYPLFLLAGFIGGVLYTFHIFGASGALKGFAGVLFLMIVTALFNPAFSHQGVTVIAVLPTGNMLTLESVLYGVGMAFKLGTVLLWFRCAGEILTADKIVYLFGKNMPVMGLLLSMTLGFIPKMQRKIREINNTSGDTRNIKHGLDKLYILITWSLEDAADQADSIKGRGYGLKGRTFYANYRFTGRDRMLTAVLLIFFLLLLAAFLKGSMTWYYYPELPSINLNLLGVVSLLIYMLMCFFPELLEFTITKLILIKLYERFS